MKRYADRQIELKTGENEQQQKVNECGTNHIIGDIVMVRAYIKERGTTYYKKCRGIKVEGQIKHSTDKGEKRRER